MKERGLLAPRSWPGAKPSSPRARLVWPAAPSWICTTDFPARLASSPAIASASSHPFGRAEVEPAAQHRQAGE